MQGSVIFDPLLSLPVLAGFAAFAVVLLGYALWRGLSGWWLRGLAAAVVLAALANPSFQQENRTPLTDIVLLVVDQSASDRISDRSQQTSAAVADLTARIAARPNTELKVITLQDAEGDGGTLLMTGLAEAMAEEPRARLAGAILLTDGQLHDIARAPDMPAPLHALLTGHKTDWDRRLIVQNAPAFAVLGEPVTLTLMIEDQGQIPAGEAGQAPLEIAIDGGEPATFTVPIGRPMELPITLPHGGMNVIQFTVPTAPGELTDRNNSAVVQINGVRDRLRVLLVSGQPHPGERTWRNLLKSDSSVDLVHFTILRPPDKQDGVPVNELSLIAFPTRELFMDKIKDFDLIIFDRYQMRGILPAIYLDNVRQYVENGGAVLIAAGPDFATADSLYHSPLGQIIPGQPTGQVINKGYRPQITELGHRHPVTAGLEAFAQKREDGTPGWGRWFRALAIENPQGSVVMSDEANDPLLILNRVGDGRIALLASDHAWLWSRGYEGGGPQLELLRRLAHWMMQEPELEEEALTATAQGQTMTITRRSMADGPRTVEITGPDGTVILLPLAEVSPGQFTADYEAPDIGLYRLKEGDKETVIALGPAAPREFEQTIASGTVLSDAVTATRGGILPLEDGLPDVRFVGEGRPAAGRGWIGLTPRHAYSTADVAVTALLPPWLTLLAAGFLFVLGWLREGRR